MLCGFHCLYNVTCFIKAALSETALDAVTNLDDMQNSSKFHAFYSKTVKKIQAVDNDYYANPTDRRMLHMKVNPLERNMLRHLLFYDEELLELKARAQAKHLKVWWRPLLIGFGFLQATQE